MDWLLIFLLTVAVCLAAGGGAVLLLVFKRRMAPKSGKVLFGGMAALAAFACVVGILFSTVLDFERDWLIFAVLVLVLAIGGVALGLALRKLDAQGQGAVAEESAEKATPADPTQEERDRQSAAQVTLVRVVAIVVVLIAAFAAVRFLIGF